MIKFIFKININDKNRFHEFSKFVEEKNNQFIDDELVIIREDLITYNHSFFLICVDFLVKNEIPFTAEFLKE